MSHPNLLCSFSSLPQIGTEQTEPFSVPPVPLPGTAFLPVQPTCAHSARDGPIMAESNAPMAGSEYKKGTSEFQCVEIFSCFFFALRGFVLLYDRSLVYFDIVVTCQISFFSFVFFFSFSSPVLSRVCGGRGAQPNMFFSAGLSNPCCSLPFLLLSNLLCFLCFGGFGNRVEKEIHLMCGNHRMISKTELMESVYVMAPTLKRDEMEFEQVLKSLEKRGHLKKKANSSLYHYTPTASQK